MHLRPTRFTCVARWRAAGILVAALLAMLLVPAEALAKRAIVLGIDGAIGPAVAEYIVRDIRAANPADDGLIVLRMNTPGGLDSSMRQIISAILASPVPVAAYVAPNGARAASAGTYITYACAVAAMAPSTNLGAATPVRLSSPILPGGQPEQPSGQKGETPKSSEPADAEGRKIFNDAVAYIRSLAKLNGRNVEWAEEAVRNAASLPASEALKLHVIDVIADDVPDLLRKIDGRSVVVAGKPERLMTAGLDIVNEGPDWRDDLLAVITDPNVAFILMLIGVYGLIFEFLSPGVVAPGLAGAISLLVALYALNLLPINYAGAALVLLGLGLMVAEAHIGAFGLLGVGGIIAFLIGAIMMFPPGVPGFGLSPAVIAGTAAATAALFILVVAMLLRSRRRAVITGKEALIGAEGETVSWEGREGRIRVSGEIWRARGSAPLAPGTRVKVVGRDGLVLVVESV
ncbi:MAG TPA: nodulation protein NfeD [Xanthobacteraceae bacterium]|jgi:membrane-bound serine protease (ClpP class)